jgi:hypothetical protein
MSSTLNRQAYEQLIAEDLEWLLKQPRSLERDHIEAILRSSAERNYGLEPWKKQYVEGYFNPKPVKKEP